jgi:hypothetical protein
MIMAALLLLLAQGTSSLGSPARIGLSLLVAGTAYFGLWLILPRSREQLSDDFSSVFSAFFKAVPSASR